jgi:hypothetical protein
MPVLVLLLIVAAVTGPLSLRCAVEDRADHACCAPQAQIAAVPCCTPGTAPVTAVLLSSVMEMQALEQVQSFMDLTGVRNAIAPGMSTLRPAALSALRPATILRT